MGLDFIMPHLAEKVYYSGGEVMFPFPSVKKMCFTPPPPPKTRGWGWQRGGEGCSHRVMSLAELRSSRRVAFPA